jgi:hypothetical protein
MTNSQERRNDMSDQDYKRGRRDGKELSYKPPVKERIFTKYPKGDKDRLDNYDQGYRHGREDRKKRK